MSQIGFISQVVSIGHKYLPSAGQARAANMGLVMSLEIPLPGNLQSPGLDPAKYMIIPLVLHTHSDEHGPVHHLVLPEHGDTLVLL